MALISMADPDTGPKPRALCFGEHAVRRHFPSSPRTAVSLGAPLADGADPSPGRLPAVSLMEDPPQRLRWQAHLEFTHNHDVGDLTWDKIAVSLPRSEKLRSLVLAGIPHSMRPQVSREGASAEGDPGLSVPPQTQCSRAPPQLWMRLSGALQKKKGSELSYREAVRNSSNDETIAAKQVRPGLGLGSTGAPSVVSPWPGRTRQPRGSPGQCSHPQTCAWSSWLHPGPSVAAERIVKKAT